MKNYLEFEKDIKTLEDEMELLKSPGSESISEVDTNKIKSTQSGVIEVKNVKFIKETIFSQQGNKIFFYFLLIYITFASFLKRKDL